MHSVKIIPKLESTANGIIEALTKGYDPKYGFGSMSVSIYDTAWVSMIRYPAAAGGGWVFPQCFDFILKHQLEDGGWHIHSTVSDSILNAASAILAIKIHYDALDPEVDHRALGELSPRLKRAQKFLSRKLDSWDSSATMPVGFEIILPALLQYLEHKGLVFVFAGRSEIEKIGNMKLARFKPSILESGVETTIVHSLEAMIGKVDYDRLKIQKRYGSMMASPSATAAYMMHVTEWDNESEEYLRHIVNRKSFFSNSGGVPNAYPSTFFEYSWAVSTLLENGFSSTDLSPEGVSHVKSVLLDGLAAGNGVIGFAPSLMPDSDDTAKAILTLNLLGVPTSAKALVREFETESHFRTYCMERDPSLSANCNVLNAILHSSDAPLYVPQIRKCVQFICSTWWGSKDLPSDKWNHSPFYSGMLTSQALVHTLSAWNRDLLDSLPRALIETRVPVTLFRLLIRLLQLQNADGTWENGDSASGEQTSYAVITLVNLLSCPFIEPLHEKITEAIEKARAYLSEMLPQQNITDYLWIEKTSYCSPVLNRSYLLGALRVPLSPCKLSGGTLSSLSAPTQRVQRFVKFWSRLPLYASMPKWELHASVLEGYLFLPELRRGCREIFPQLGPKEDKYFEYIPFTWVGANNLHSGPLSAHHMYIMMVISYLNYQVDEFIERAVGVDCAEMLPEVKQTIERIFSEIDSACESDCSLRSNGILGDSVHQNGATRNGSGVGNQPEAAFKIKAKNGTNGTKIPNGIMASNGTKASNGTNTSNGTMDSNGNNNVNGTDRLGHVYSTLKRFVAFILLHGDIKAAKSADKQRLKRELRAFLLAQVRQLEDNAQPNGINTSYLRWVRGTSADNTSCIYSFAFLLCLMSGTGESLQTPEEIYVAEDFCTHLATSCRMYNDYGSLVRDRDEHNINSLDFSEFAGHGDDENRKKLLRELAGYERSRLTGSLQTLEQILMKSGKRQLRALIRMFWDVTDTYGQIYIVRDIGVRTK